MKKLLVGLAALPFLAGIAMADQPMPLSDAQMDTVTAGLVAFFAFPNGPIGITNGVVTATTAIVIASFPTLDGAVSPGFPTVTFR
jgi:hypothetical protein